MSNPLAALVRAHSRHVEWTLALPHLGLPGCERGGYIDAARLPAPDLREFDNRTKDPTVLCVQRTNAS